MALVRSGMRVSGWVCERESLCGCVWGKASVCGSRILGGQLGRSRQRNCHVACCSTWHFSPLQRRACNFERASGSTMGRGCGEQPCPSTSRPLTDAHSPTAETWSPQAQTSLTSSVTLNCAPWRTSWLMQPAVQGACPTILVSGAPGLPNLLHRGEPGLPNILANGHPIWLILSSGALSLLQHLSEQSATVQPCLIQRGEAGLPASSAAECSVFPNPSVRRVTVGPASLTEERQVILPFWLTGHLTQHLLGRKAPSFHQHLSEQSATSHPTSSIGEIQVLLPHQQRVHSLPQPLFEKRHPAALPPLHQSAQPNLTPLWAQWPASPASSTEELQTTLNHQQQSAQPAPNPLWA